MFNFLKNINKSSSSKSSVEPLNTLIDPEQISAEDIQTNITNQLNLKKIKDAADFDKIIEDAYTKIINAIANNSFETFTDDAIIVSIRGEYRRVDFSFDNQIKKAINEKLDSKGIYVSFISSMSDIEHGEIVFNERYIIRIGKQDDYQFDFNSISKNMTKNIAELRAEIKDMSDKRD